MDIKRDKIKVVDYNHNIGIQSKYWKLFEYVCKYVSPKCPTYRGTYDNGKFMN
jgi:hypothetical protein